MRQSRMLGVVPLLALPLFAGCGGDASALPEGEGEAGEPSAGTAEEHLSAVDLRVANYGYDAGGWRVGQHPRMMADVNGDGKADIVGFGYDGVYVSLD